MRNLLFIVALFLPSSAFTQSLEGNYQAIFFDVSSGNRSIVVEFSVSAEMSLSGILRIDGSEKPFIGAVGKNGKFEALIEQIGNYTYKLKGKFDQDNKISLVQRETVGSGLNKSVSEWAVEGQFARAKVPLSQTGPPVGINLGAEVSDTGRSSLKVLHSQTLYGTTWTDLIAAAGFDTSRKPSSSADPRKDTAADGSPDILVVNVRTTVEGQQALMINIPVSTQGKKSWGQNELRAASYREVKGAQRHTFLTGATFQTDPRYADGKIEIVRENESQIVFKLTNFKIKKLNKDEFVKLDGFIYAAISQ